MERAATKTRRLRQVEDLSLSHPKHLKGMGEGSALAHPSASLLHLAHESKDMPHRRNQRCQTWQRWARGYQRAVGAEAPGRLVTHTLSKRETHREAEKTVQPRCPNHAAEGTTAAGRGAPPPDRYLLGAGRWAWWLAYLPIVRAVRLTDGKSQEGG